MTSNTDFTMTAQATRAERINDLAYEQAIFAAENETPMDAELALALNAGELRHEYERRQFKHDFRRHMRNIADGNRFYLS